MIIEISNIQTKFDGIYWLIEEFFSKKARHTEVEILAFNFPKYVTQIEVIEDSLRSCIQYGSDVVRGNDKFLAPFIGEANGFYNQVITIFYDGFVKTYDFGRTQSITHEILNKNADLHKTLIEEFGRIGFDKYKVILFDLLNVFKNEVEDLGQNNLKLISQDQSIASIPSETLLTLNDFAVDTIILIQLYKVLYNRKVIKVMKHGDFLQCFDFKKEPEIKPEFLQKYIFVYALMQIPGMNLAIAKTNFGIKQYDIIKTKINNPKNKYDRPKSSYFSDKKQILLHEIDSVLKYIIKN